MVDFSTNDGYFKIEKGSCFSKAIVKELGLDSNEVKKLDSVWSKIFEIAERENMKNLDLVFEGQEFKFSESGWQEIVSLVNTALGKEIESETLKKDTTIVNNIMGFELTDSNYTTPNDSIYVDTVSAIANSLEGSLGKGNDNNWENIKKEQDRINALPTNKERVIEWNKHFNNDGKNYVIVDKENFTATVYSSDGKIVKEFEVGLGRMLGDANLRRSKTNPADDLNYTTAGIYTANYRGNGKDSYSQLYNDNILTLSNDALRKRGVGSGETGVALHQVPNGNSERLASLKQEGANKENNRVSDGCVNFLPEEFVELMSYIDGVGTKVYILPEDDNNYMCVKNGELQFAQKTYTGDVPTTLTTKDEIQAININSNSDLSTEGKNMMKALCDYKMELCKDLEIDNDTYNNLAVLALGIAGQETNYGDSLAGLKKGTPYFLKEKLTGLFNFVKEDIMGNHSYNSRGLTQMKIQGYTDPTVQEQFKKYGITPENLQNGEKSAIATIIVLSFMLKNELPALKEKMTKQNVSTQDALLYCWNNKKKEIQNGTATPDKNIYIQNVKDYMSNFSLNQMV